MKERQHYRIPYPLPERPSLQTGGEEYEVIDCSAQGLRFAMPFGRLPQPGTMLHGTLLFRRGARVEVAGTVIWAHSHEVALHLSETEIPFGVLMDEQRYLRTHYPMWP